MTGRMRRHRAPVLLPFLSELRFLLDSSDAAAGRINSNSLALSLLKMPQSASDKKKNRKGGGGDFWKGGRRALLKRTPVGRPEGENKVAGK